MSMQIIWDVLISNKNSIVHSIFTSGTVLVIKLDLFKKFFLWKVFVYHLPQTFSMNLKCTSQLDGFSGVMDEKTWHHDICLVFFFNSWLFDQKKSWQHYFGNGFKLHDIIADNKFLATKEELCGSHDSSYAVRFAVLWKCITFFNKKVFVITFLQNCDIIKHTKIQQKRVIQNLENSTK